MVLLNEKLQKKKLAPKPCCLVMADTYEPLRVLGEGGQGIVFLCRHKASNALVACKTSLAHYRLHQYSKEQQLKTSIKSKLTQLLSGRSRKKTPINISKEDMPAEQAGQADDELRYEMEMMKRACGHPNILSVQDSFESEDGFVHLLMPFCEDGSLLDQLLLHVYHSPSFPAGPKPLLDDGRAAKVIASLASAISHCHDHGIVHRDVKLDNIFISRHKKGDVDEEDEEDILLGDFGSSTILCADRKLSLFAGTKLYTAPEVKQRSYDHRIDIWSLGIVLHVLLSGAFLADDLKLHASIYDYQACDLLLGMLCVDPVKRCTLQQVLSHPWILKNTRKLQLQAVEGESQATIK